MIAVVRDDGDVDAFLIRHVVQAIERRAEHGSTIGVVADEIRTIFQSNVGISAWGLAIHSHARILATSSNMHEVRVFKFGLLHVDDESTEDDSVLPTVGSNESGRTDQRETDVTETVLNGESNIPYISFCNTGDDPEARWLLTTDISGVCRVMDLHLSQPVQAFRFGRSFMSPNTGGFDRLNAGWALMFLDRRSFKPEASVYAALVMESEGTLPGIKRNRCIWDLSETVQLLSESQEPFVYTRPKTRVPNDLSVTSVSLNDSGSERRARQEGVALSESSQSSASVEIEIEIPEDQEEDEDDRDSSVYMDEDDEGQSDSENMDDFHDAQEDPGSPDPQRDDANEVVTIAPWAEDEDENDEPDSDLPLVDDADDPEDEGTEDSISFTSFYNGASVCGHEPQFVRSTNICEDLPCPILHASIRNVYLLQPSNQEHKSGAYMPPMVGIANPLRQKIQQDFEYLRMFERLNMSAYIPTLGVVVLASQKGRALVLSLTKISGSVAFPAEMQDRDICGKTNYAMRVECILPFAHQEKANQRPFAPLHGIAVGPLQGYETVEEERKRWRLLMMYQDHSILSYEIARGKTRARNSVIAVERLVV